MAIDVQPVLTECFAGGTQGSAVPATSGAYFGISSLGTADGMLFDVVTASADTAITYDDTVAHSGTLSCLIATTTGASGDCFGEWTSAGLLADAAAQQWYRLYLYMTANPAANHQVFAMLVSGTRAADVVITTSGTLSVRNTSGTPIVTTTSTVPLNAWFRIEGYITSNASTGQVELKLFNSPDSATPTETQTSAANQDTARRDAEPGPVRAGHRQFGRAVVVDGRRGRLRLRVHRAGRDRAAHDLRRPVRDRVHRHLQARRRHVAAAEGRHQLRAHPERHLRVRAGPGPVRVRQSHRDRAEPVHPVLVPARSTPRRAAPKPWWAASAPSRPSSRPARSGPSPSGSRPASPPAAGSPTPDAGITDWVAWQPDLSIFTGDFTYEDPTFTDMPDQLGCLEFYTWFYGNEPLVRQAWGYYCRSNHDTSSATTYYDDTDNTFTAENLLASQEFFPHGTLGDTVNNPVHSLCESWVTGRVRFIKLDIRNIDRSPGMNTDNSSKTMLGAVQLAWLYGQLTEPEPLKIIITDTQWLGTTAPSLGADPELGKWWSYQTERAAIITQMIASWSRMRNVLLIHGDFHGVAVATAQQSAANAGGGFPVYCAAPVRQTGLATHNPGTFTAYYNNAGGNCCQYGRVTVTDSGRHDQRQFPGVGCDQPGRPGAAD